MRYHEIMESVVYDQFVPGSGHLKVVRNPSKTQFANLLASFNQHEARGILTDDALYVWDSWVATHDEVKGLLALRGYELILHVDRVEFRGAGQTADNYDDATEEDEQENEATAEWIASEAPIQRLYGARPNVRVYYPE